MTGHDCEYRKRGWIAWGLSGMASFAGISPSQAIHQDLMQAPAEPDIDALYDALRFGGSDDANSATAVTRLQSSSVTLQVKATRCLSMLIITKCRMAGLHAAQSM